MRKLTQQEKNQILMGLISDDLVREGYSPITQYIKPVLVEDEEKDYIRHICNPQLGVLLLPKRQYVLPEYWDNYDQGVDCGQEVFTVYVCPYCQKVFLIKEGYF